MTIEEGQADLRTRFRGGFYGQLVSGLLWLLCAGVVSFVGLRQGIITLVVSGFFIFPLTELGVKLGGGPPQYKNNPMYSLGMQVAFVLPLSMPLLVPISAHRLTLVLPAMMILLGAHYCPFVFLYGMRMFAILAALLLAGGVMIGLYLPEQTSLAAWYTGAVLLVFAIVGRSLSQPLPQAI